MSDVRTLTQAVLAEARTMSQRTIAEFQIGDGRADVVGISADSLDGWEVKTAQDSLKRFPRQVHIYSQFFDRCCAVVDIKHVDGVLRMAPEWWGIYIYVPGEPLSALRLPTEHTAPNNLLGLLWRREMELALKRWGVQTRTTWSLDQLQRSLTEVVSPQDARKMVRWFLLGRKDDRFWRWFAIDAVELPWPFGPRWLETPESKPVPQLSLFGAAS